MTSIVEGGKLRYLAPEICNKAPTISSLIQDASDGSSSLPSVNFPTPERSSSNDSESSSVLSSDSTRRKDPSSLRTSKASDTYAYAMTLLELATLQKPFVEYRCEIAAFAAASRGERPKMRCTTFPSRHWCGYGVTHHVESEREAFRMRRQIFDELWALFEDMWRVEPERRPGMDLVQSRLALILHSLPESFRWP